MKSTFRLVLAMVVGVAGIAVNSSWAASFRDEVLARNPIGYWEFEDLTDSSGNGNTLTAFGDAYIISATAGRVGKAARLDGANGGFYVDTPAGNALNLTGSTWSINLWCNVDPSLRKNPKTTIMVAKRYGATWYDKVLKDRFWSNYGLWMNVNGGNVLVAPMYRNPGLDYGPSNLLPPSADNTWHMATVSHNGTTKSYYWDGQLVNSVPSDITSGLTNSAYRLIIGNAGSPGATDGNDNAWRGVLDEVAIFKNALSAADVAAIYAAAGRAPSPEMFHEEILKRKQEVESLVNFQEPQVQYVNGFGEALLYQNSNSLIPPQHRFYTYRKFEAKNGFWSENLPLMWNTRLVPEKKDTVFVFAGNFRPQTGGAPYYLEINGKRVLEFECVNQDKTWRSNDILLHFDLRQIDWHGSLGVFFLRVPANYIEAGKPVTLTFDIQPGPATLSIIGDYPDILDYERKRAKGEVPASADFSEYSNLAHSPDVEPLGPPIETPHVKWAQPYAGGKIRALFIMPYEFQRDAVEMVQRFDIESDVVGFNMLWDRTGEGQNETEIVGFLKKKPYDVIVSAHYPVWTLSAEAKALLREKVLQGTGLIYIPPNQLFTGDVAPVETWLGSNLKWHSVEAPAFTTRNVPVKALPTGGVHIDGWGTFGDGRVLLINYRPLRLQSWLPYLLPPDVQGSTAGIGDLLLWYPYWEYYYSGMARSMLWASKKEVETAIKLPDEMTFTREVNGEVPISITSPGNRPVRLAWTVRDMFYREESAGEKTMRLNSAANDVQIEIPKGLIRGRHFLDVILRDGDGKTLDWGSMLVNVEAPVWIEKVEPAKDLFEPTEPLQMKWEVAGEKVKASNEVYEVLVHDAYERLIYRSETTSPQIEIPPQRVLSTYHLASVRLRRGADVLSEARMPLYVRNTNGFFNRFFVASFIDHQPTHLRTFFDNFLREQLLVDATVGDPWKGHAWNRLKSASGVDILPEQAGFLSLTDPTDPGQEEGRLRRIADLVKDRRKYGVPAYSSHEEMRAGDYGSTEAGRTAFREYLKARYSADVATASKIWGKPYSTWEEFAPISIEEARKGNKASAWKDYRDFVDDTWNRFSVTGFGEAVKRGDGKAAAGCNATYRISPITGYNWSDIIRETYFGLEYLWQDDIFPEVRRSFIPGTLGHFIGYSHDAAVFNYEAWYATLHGSKGLVNYNTFDLSVPWMNWSWLHPTYAPTQRTLWWQETVRELTGGIGRLLMESRRENNRVAILFSHDSMQRLYFDDDRTDNVGGVYGLLFRASLNNFQDILESLAMQYDYVDEKGIRSGTLVNFSVVILPMTVALNERTIEFLQKFVQDGGTIIADSGTAFFDGNINRRSDDRFLRDVFGISIVSPELEKAKYSEVASRGGWLNHGFTAASFPVIGGRSHIRLDGGVQAGEYSDGIPALISMSHGKGQAVFLNFVPAVKEQNILLLGKILRDAGVKAPVEIVSDKGQVRDVECVRFKRGPVTILALQKKYKYTISSSEDFRAEFSEPFHVYDVRKRTYLGKKNTIPMHLAEGETAIIALLPYEVEALEISPRKLQVNAGETAEFDIALRVGGDSAANHIAHIEVIGPEGPLSHYKAQELLEGGKGTYLLPLALNDTPGEWQLRATDVISGKESIVRFNVR